MARRRVLSYALGGGRMRPDEFREARSRMAEKPIPELIEILASDNLRTRFLAEMCLRDATNT